MQSNSLCIVFYALLNCLAVIGMRVSMPRVLCCMLAERKASWLFLFFTSDPGICACFCLGWLHVQ